MTENEYEKALQALGAKNVTTKDKETMVLQLLSYLQVK